MMMSMCRQELLEAATGAVVVMEVSVPAISGLARVVVDSMTFLCNMEQALNSPVL